mmetsp:Transcript_4227/g.15575  ORF Transcript_4227/g.15575 Transcript_4227/m.15575 type:complete len:303 (-) Transcript_4227:129-1037(-)
MDLLDYEWVDGGVGAPLALLDFSEPEPDAAMAPPLGGDALTTSTPHDKDSDAASRGPTPTPFETDDDFSDGGDHGDEDDEGDVGDAAEEDGLLRVIVEAPARAVVAAVATACFLHILMGDDETSQERRTQLDEAGGIHLAALPVWKGAFERGATAGNHNKGKYKVRPFSPGARGREMVRRCGERTISGFTDARVALIAGDLVAIVDYYVSFAARMDAIFALRGRAVKKQINEAADDDAARAIMEREILLAIRDKDPVLPDKDDFGYVPRRAATRARKAPCAPTASGRKMPERSAKRRRVSDE